tara:strand:+ start:390 stop:1262 length:873 start_codon:yes stop_codon:yes gene_type:complete
MAGISTGLLIASLAISAGSAGMSFAQAGKQNKLRKKAEAEASRKMALAHKSLEKNNMESLSIPMEAYEAQNEAILVAGSIAMDAARDGAQRGVGTVAQNVLNFEQDKLRETSIRQGQDLFNLAAATAEQEQSNQDKRAGLYMQEAEGAQMAAADATEARNAAIQAGIGSVTDMAQTGLEAGALYKKNKGMQQAAVGGMSMDKDGFSNFGNVEGKKGGVSKSMGPAGSDGFTNLDLGAVGEMDRKQFRQFKRELNPKQKNLLFNNPEFYKLYGQGTNNYYNFDYGGLIGEQ